MSRGRFISFEGGEGAGKSTAIAEVRKFLEARGIEVVQTREPGGTPIGEAIRGILLDRANPGLADTCELLLMFAARAQLVREVIEPALSRGAWILSDRFADSSFAYQGGGRGIDREFIASLQRRAVGIEPELTFLLDLPPRVGQARQARGEGLADRIEAEAIGFFDRVREAYLSLAESHPERIRVIDASAKPDAVADAACAILSEWMESRPRTSATVSASPRT